MPVQSIADICTKQFLLTLPIFCGFSKIIFPVDRGGQQCYAMPIENGTGTPVTERRRTNMIVTRFGMMMCMMDMGMMTMPKPLCASAKNLSCV